MDWIVFGVVTLWLILVSWFDLRKGEVPHCAWIIVPLVAASIYRLWQGGWQLIILAGMVVLISERQRLGQYLSFIEVSRIITWLPLLFLSLFWSVQISPLTTFAIVGFWIAWELGWWGGADAVSAIALSLVWPDPSFFLAFFGCHAIVALGLMAFTYKEEKKVKLHRVPGLPVMLLAVLCFTVLYQITSHS
jgi:hypothetical protein